MVSIQLIISDIEGCVIPGGREKWDLAPLVTLRSYNDQAARPGEHGGSVLPPLTLCSGRPAQYVEAVGEVIGCRLPMICENGAVMYDPESGRHLPLYDDEQRDTMKQVRELADELFEATGRARVAEGKALCVSLIPTDFDHLPRLLDSVEQELAQRGLNGLTITRSSKAVDITPNGITKGTGVEQLLKRLGAQWDQVLGVGDGGNDIPFLTRCGQSATPANGLDFVQEAVQYVAKQTHANGLLEIIRRFTGWACT